MAKILLVEDDPLILKIFTTRLNADGYTVITAENGQEGLDKAFGEKPDVIVLDIMMPKVDGFGVLEKLRNSEPTQQIPILVYSNLWQEEEVARAKQMGATEFIVKANISPTEMVNKIKQYLSHNS